MRRTAPWLLAALPLLLARVTLVGLTDPSEARYGQICREMADGGDWLAPRWQAIPHLEKPPLAYWSGALGIRLLGKTELAVRLGALVALLLSAFWAAGIARRLAGPKAGPPALLGILLSPLFVAAGAACLTDPFLLAATTLFFHAVVRRLHDDDPRALDLAALALVLGILAKGHMVLLFTVVPMALARTGVFRELWRLRRVLLILALSVPWFAMIEIRFPGFLLYQLGAVAGRAAGSGHKAPFFMYLLELAVGLLPFVLYAPKGVRSVGEPYRRLLLLWLLVPLVVFTVAKSRLWTYILPAAPPLVIFAAVRLAAPAAAGARWLKWVLAIAGALLLALSGIGVRLGLGDLRPLVPYVGGALLLCALWLALTRGAPRIVPVAGLAAIAIAGFVAAAYSHESLFRIHRRFAKQVNELARESDAKIVLAGLSLPSVGFYADRPVRIEGEGGRLAIEEEAWGQSPLYEPGADLKSLLNTNFRDVIVLEEKRGKESLEALAPGRPPLLAADGIAAVQGRP
jgi:4-amino-4-deoxy-L-arabinose transferase-like glycosyltransferase